MDPPKEIVSKIIQNLAKVDVETLETHQVISLLKHVIRAQSLGLLDKIETELASRVPELTNFESSLICRTLTQHNQSENKRVEFQLFMSEFEPICKVNIQAFDFGGFLSIFCAFLSSAICPPDLYKQFVFELQHRRLLQMNIDDMLLLLMFNSTCTNNLVEIPSKDRL